jgi:hypothetical protein
MKNGKKLSLVMACLFLGMTLPISGWTDSIGNKVKKYIDEATDALKHGVDKLKGDFHAIQDYLDHYPWKGMVQTEATSGPVTLGHLKLNGHSKAIVASPGQEIDAEVECTFNPEETTFFGHYEVVIGLKDVGPQVAIGEAGLPAGRVKEKFTLVAPEQNGIYQIRFRPAKIIFHTLAFDSWKDAEGNEPDAAATIGIIIVK